MDGFDVQAIGYVAPALSQDWKITGAILGTVLTAALIGVLFGSILLSMLADKLGRRPVLLGATLFFSIATLVTAFVQTVPELIAIRFVAGVALGSIMPNAMALVGEFSPHRARVPLMVVVAVGFNVGATLGGVVSFWLIPHYGWRSIFYFGGAVPLVIGGLMAFLLPESPQFLALHGKSPGKLGHLLQRVDSFLAITPNTRFIVREHRETGLPMVKLFQEGRATRTVLLWTVYFMNLLNLYFLSSWLPTVTTPLIKAAGVSGSYALLVGTTLQLGGATGVALGWFAARLGFGPVLTTCFIVGSGAIALIGQPHLSLRMLFGVVFVAGLGIVGAQSVINALAATLYPTDLRSTGIGAGLGIGRIGSIVGPQLAGVLIGLHWSVHQLFLAAAVPALLSAVAMVLMHFSMNPSAPAASAKSSFVSKVRPRLHSDVTE